MPVQLIVDGFAIDDQNAVVVNTSDESIDAARLAIYQQLHNKDDTVLRIRLNNLGLYKHFREFEGINGFSVQRLIPRLLLAERLKTPLPAWLTDDNIVELGLLKNTAFIPMLAFEDQLLIACHPDLLNGSDFQTFIAALKQQTTVFLSILKQESIKKRLIQHLYRHLAINKEAAELFITHLLHSSSISGFCQHLAYQQYLQHLRGIVSDYQLGLALPAQAVSSELLTALPLLPLTQQDAQQLPDIFLSILNALSQKIITQQQPPERLAAVLIVDWEIVLTEVQSLTEANRQLVTDELVERLRTMDNPTAQQLAEQLDCSCYPLLSETASVDEVLTWSAGYFDYLRPVLLNKQIPEENINYSFTTWLLTQSARIVRSNADWRYCAKQIDKFLAQNYLVIVVVIDALSALNQDILLAELTGFDSVTRTDEMLFAPLPTLTEVCKIAVLTGKHCHLLANDSETALRQNYAAYLPDTNALKVIKSWEDVSQHIAAQTNLVVFFENRLDERLHDGASFAKHREDITPIVRQLKRSIQSWLKDAGQRDVVFFITADHGMTVTQGGYSGQLIGEVKDRTMKIQQSDKVTDDFVRLTQDSKSTYAAIKTRYSLTSNTALAHGGLTPEEVLIPFITLTTRPPKSNEMPVKVNVTSHCIRLGKQYWQVELNLMVEEQVENLKLTLEPPFMLEKRPLIDIIRAHKSLDIILKFTADCEQQGLVALDLKLYYDTVIAHEKNSQRLDINFPPPLLERDAGTQNFEDMF